MWLLIDLVDHEGNVHEHSTCSIDKKASVKELKKRIQSIYSVDPVHQRIFFKNTELLVGTLEEVGLNDNDTIVVKHSLLENWAVFCERYKSAQKLKKAHQIKDAVDNALQQLKLLQSDNFFLTYADFRPTARMFKKEFAHYVDADNKYIEYAATDYFSILFDDSPEHPKIKVKCHSKEKCGAQGGLICVVVKDDVDLGKYHMKTHLCTASRTSNHTSADLRELFVYRLLHLIGVGPEVHFLPNAHHSTFALYIATKDVPGFTRADEARRRISDECKYQLELLEKVFYLCDLHAANYGVDKDNNLCIVDFQIGQHTKSAAVGEYLHTDKEERRRIGKTSFMEWNLAAAVDKAIQRVAVQKDLFKEKRVSFLPSKNFEEYLSQVKNNVKMFGDVFA